MSDTSSLVYGGDILLFVGSGSTKIPVAFSKSAKLSISMTTKDATSKDSGIYVEKIPGRLDWSASIDGDMSFTVSGSTNTIDDLYALMIQRLPVNVVFASKTGTSPAWTVDATKKTFTGLAYITSADMSTDSDTATYSVKLDGTGALTMV